MGEVHSRRVRPPLGTLGRRARASEPWRLASPWRRCCGGATGASIGPTATGLFASIALIAAAPGLWSWSLAAAPGLAAPGLAAPGGGPRAGASRPRAPAPAARGITAGGGV